MDIVDRLSGTESEKEISPTIDIAPSADVMARIVKIRGALSRTAKIADLLDRKLLDPLIGWFFEMIGLPIIGDIPTTIAGLYIVFEAKRAGLPNTKIVQMLANVGLDFAVDLIPVLGNIADFFVRSNVANVAIMRKYAEELERKKA